MMKAFTFTVIRLILIFIISFFITSSLATSSQSHPHLSTNSKVGVNNIENIKIGMTKEEAELISGVKLIKDPEQGFLTEHCYYLYPNNDLKIGFMMDKNKIVRVDVYDERITTISGAKISDTEEEIIATYPNIEIRQGFYSGKYFIYRPKDFAYQEYLLLFEAEPLSYDENNQPQGTHKVKKFRIGYRDEVELLVEGCS